MFSTGGSTSAGWIPDTQVSPQTGRAVSPVVGIVLLVAVVAITAAVAGSLVVGLTDETDPAPTVAMELEPTGDGVSYTLEHVSGDDLSGERTRLIGVADEEALPGEEFRAGEDVTVVPVEEQVRLVWDGDDTSYTVQTFDVDSSGLAFDAGSIDYRCDWVEQNINANGDLDMNDDTAVCDVTDGTNTGLTDINIDINNDAALLGNIDTDGDVDVDSSIVASDVTTDGNDITITGGSEIYGDVVAQPGQTSTWTAIPRSRGRSWSPVETST